MLGQGRRIARHWRRAITSAGRARRILRTQGRGAVAIKHMVDDWATEFGFYAAQFHSRPSFYSAIKSLRSGAPFVLGDPGNLNPQFLTEFPEDIRIFGATFDTRFRGGAVFGEFTYRPNQPLQYNTADILAAITSATAPSPLRAQVNALAPGATFHAWERHDAVQLQLGATGTTGAVLGAAGLNWLAEVVYKGVPDLPDPAVIRFGRSDVLARGRSTACVPHRRRRYSVHSTASFRATPSPIACARRLSTPA